MKRRSRQFLVLPLLALLAASQAAAESVGPYGGWINDLKEDGSGRILAAASFGGIYRSSDDAESWQQIYNGSLIFDPLSVAVNASGHIFVGSEGIAGVGFLRSTDDGASWQVLSNTLSSRTVDDILVMGSGEIFACTRSNGLYRSTNNGTTFTAVSSLPASSTTDIEATSTGTLFAGARFTSNRMYRSTDNGTTWQLVTAGLAGDVNDIFISAADEVYAATESSVYKTTNNGATWVNLNPPNNGYTYPSIVLSDGNIYAAFYGGIFSGGVYRSTDGGATWTQDSGLPAKSIGQLLTTSSGMVFVGGHGYGVYRRVNAMAGRGMDWEWKNNGLANTWVTSISEDVISGNLYTSTVDAQMFRSTNSGSTWQSSSSGIPEYEWIYDTAVNTDGTVFASGAYQGIYRSTNQGTTWTNVYPVAATAIGCNAQGHVFAGQGSRMYRSTNNGNSWTFATLSLVQNIADIAFDGVVVYAATGTESGFGSQGVYRSPDNGNTWGAFNNGLPTMDVTTVAVGDEAPGTPCRISCGTNGNGVFDLDEAASNLVPTWVQNPFTTGLVLIELKKRRSDLVGLAQAWSFFGGESCPFPLDLNAIDAEIEAIDEVLGPNRAAGSGVESVVLLGTTGHGIFRETETATGVGDDALPDGVGAPAGLHVATPFPNPFQDASTLAFTLTEAGPVRVDVFDVSGRIVRTLADGAMPRGAHTLVWDGRNASRREVAAGVYFYRLTTASETATRRAVLAR